MLFACFLPEIVIDLQAKVIGYVETRQTGMRPEVFTRVYLHHIQMSGYGDQELATELCKVLWCKLDRLWEIVLVLGLSDGPGQVQVRVFTLFFPFLLVAVARALHRVAVKQVEIPVKRQSR